MERLKKIDIKTWFIIILGIALIVTFMFGQKNNIDTHKDEITGLHNDNALLIKRNDSLINANVKLDTKILEINTKLETNVKELADTQLELDKLKKKKNEIPKIVNNMSANWVSSSFTDILNKRTESKNNR